MILSYFITFSHGTNRVPACGDWMMSYTTIIHWIIGLSFLDSIKKSELNQKIFYLQHLVYFFLIFVGIFLVYVKSEYLIGILISAVLVKILWWIYDSSVIMVYTMYGPFVTSLTGQFYVWLESAKVLKSGDMSDFEND